MNLKVDNMEIYGVSDQQAHTIKARVEFVQQYCQEKGWNKDELSIEQILEIRQQEAWKNPS